MHVNVLMAEAGDCPIAAYQESNGETVYLWQQTFEDGVNDLVMSKTTPERGDAKRVTFGGSRQLGCHYLALAIARGGDWGWHIAWSNEHGVFYARMDGEAWVSSPPKLISSSPAKQLSFEKAEAKLKLSWEPLDPVAPAYAVSNDEGRSW